MPKRLRLLLAALSAPGLCIGLGACAARQAPGRAPARSTLPAGTRDALPPGGYSPVEVQVNTFTPSAQAHAALDIDRDGNIVVAWDSRRQQRGSCGVYARRFDPLGRPLSPEVPVNLYTTGMQAGPALAAGPDGAVWIAWNSYGQDGAGWGIVARRFGPGLASATPEIGVNVTRDGDQCAPALAVNRAGQALIVWVTQPARAATRIVARLFDGCGRPAGPELAAGAPAAGCRDTVPTVAFVPAAADGAGLFVVAWARSDPAGEPAGIFAQRFSPAGAAIGDEFAVSEPDGLQHIEPALAAGAPGRFAVAWLSADDAGYSVRARWFDDRACALGPARLVAASATGFKSGVAAAMSPDGRTVICYNSSGGQAAQDDVWAVVFAADGQRCAGPQRVNRHVQGVQALGIASGARRVAWGAHGELAFAWSGDGGRGDRSAANLTVLLRSGLRRQLAQRPAPRPVVAAAPWRVAEPELPPVFDPNWRPRPPAYGARSDGVDFGFEGVPGTGWHPPDPELAVGRDHVVVIVNGQIAFFDKAGNNLFRDEIEDDYGFWGEVGASYFVFDPEVHYDPYVDRFWAMACERSDTGRSMFLLAVSDDGDPLGTWYKWRFDVTALAGNDIDSPNLAFDDQAVYLSADFFGPDKYLVYMLDKATLVAGGTPPATHLLIVGQQSFGLPVTYDADAPAQYMIESTEFTTNTIVRFHAIRDPLGTPQRVTSELPVAPYRYPGRPPQKGTSNRPYLFEPRFWSCMYRNGSLWAVHHIRRVGQEQTIARWYEFHMNGWPLSGLTPTVAQWGELDAGPTKHEYFPSIFADDAGNAAITFARSASDEYIGMWRAVRRHDDPPGSFRAQVLVKASTSPYTIYQRWGDYSGTQTDPFDPCVFWGHHEWTDAPNDWRTWVGRYENYNDADLDHDGTVGQSDLGLLLGDWGCLGDCVGDIDGDGDTDQSDLGILLANWGDTCG